MRSWSVDHFGPPPPHLGKIEEASTHEDRHGRIFTQSTRHIHEYSRGYCETFSIASAKLSILMVLVFDIGLVRGDDTKVRRRVEGRKT
jgi:hypothetical protein